MVEYAEDKIDKSKLQEASLTEFIEGASPPEEDPDVYKEWVGMPEFNQEDKNAFQTIIVRFQSEQDVMDFAKRMGQSITLKTKSIWHPKKEHDLTQWCDT